MATGGNRFTARASTYRRLPPLDTSSRADQWEQLLYYTVWNYHLQFLYWVLAAALSLRASSRRARCRGAEAHARAVAALFEVCLPLSILVALVMWGVLAPAAERHGGDPFAPASIDMHAVNTACLLAEFASCRMPVVGHRLVYPLTLAGVYSVFGWVQHVYTGTWMCA